jgi:hypothetical protein
VHQIRDSRANLYSLHWYCAIICNVRSLTGTFVDSDDEVVLSSPATRPESAPSTSSRRHSNIASEHTSGEVIDVDASGLDNKTSQLSLIDDHVVSTKHSDDSQLPESIRPLKRARTKPKPPVRVYDAQE